MSEQEKKAGKKHLDIHFIKSNFFRVVHADGVWGGITPSGNIQMAVFSHRTPLPQFIKEEVEKDGERLVPVGEEIDKREGKKGILREMEVDVVMDMETAESIAHWLLDNVDKLKKLSTNPS